MLGGPLQAQHGEGHNQADKVPCAASTTDARDSQRAHLLIQAQNRPASKPRFLDQSQRRPLPAALPAWDPCRRIHRIAPRRARFSKRIHALNLQFTQSATSQEGDKTRLSAQGDGYSRCAGHIFSGFHAQARSARQNQVRPTAPSASAKISSRLAGTS